MTNEGRATESEALKIMDMIKLIKENWLRIIIAIIICLNMPRILNYGLTLYYGEHPADRIKSQLTEMYQEIEPLPGATILKEGSFVRENGGSVYGDYLTDLSIQEVLSYYDKEFKRNGWNFKEIYIVTEGRTDTGGRSARYTKGDYMGFIGYDNNKLKQEAEQTEFTVYFEFYRGKKY